MRVLALTALLLAFPAAAQAPCEQACAAGAQCIEGRCQFTCESDSACREGRVCLRGVCEEKLPRHPGSPPTSRRADATHAERFRFSSVVPPGFHLVREPYWGRVVGGAITFALSYVPFVVVGIVSQRPLVAIPFAGPIVSFVPGQNPVVDVFVAIGLGLDVAVQAAGIGMLIGGLATSRGWLERDEAKPGVSFTPGAPGAPLGASVTGRF